MEFLWKDGACLCVSVCIYQMQEWKWKHMEQMRCDETVNEIKQEELKGYRWDYVRNELRW